MKLLIKSTIAILLLLSFQSCTKCIIEPEPNRENELQIRFTNISEDKIKQFSFDGQLIGNLSAGKTTRYYSFNSIALNAIKRLLLKQKQNTMVMISCLIFIIMKRIHF